MKIKLFSHIDLDGYGCNIVLKNTVGKVVQINDEDITNVNYDKINEVVSDFIQNKKYNDYDIVFITDISVNEEVAEMINSVNNNSKSVKFLLFDHHQTALFLNKYDWAIVKIEDENGKVCGTSLFYDYIINSLIPDNYVIGTQLDDFVEKVRRYDTWEWYTKYNDSVAKELNDLFYLIGKDRFIEAFSNPSENSVKWILRDYSMIIELNKEKIDKYIKKKNNQIIEKEINGLKVGVVFAEQYISELGNRLSEMNPQYDLIAIISDGTISYRTVKEGVDCGKLAELFGGGGHIKASGSRIREVDKMAYLDLLFR